MVLSRLRLTFAPRDGQTAVGTCVVSADGDIQQRVVECESVVMRFPDASMAAPIPLSPDYGGGDFPKIVVLEKHFEIAPNSMYVHLGDVSAGPFIITNTVNVDPASVEWSVDSGTMTPAAGASSTLLIDQPPTENDPIVITAEAEFDEVFSAEDTTFVWLCSPHGLLLQSSTTNFSPHLGETSTFSLDVSGCEHDPEEGWIEAEVMRETTAGWQHVCWIDVSLAVPGHQKRRLHKAESLTITWNGIATDSAALADSPDVFTEGSAPFHRALPEVISGEPVPPPYYTIVFRYRVADSDTAEIIDETSTTVYVPQVVKVEMTDEAFEEFKRPLLYPETFYPHLLGASDVVGCKTNVVLYAGSPDSIKSEVLDRIVEECQRSIPSDVNIIFTHKNVNGKYKHVTVLINNRFGNSLGMTTNMSWRNQAPDGIAKVYSTRMIMLPCHDRYRTENDAFPVSSYDPRLFPFSYYEFAHALASVAVHETGHMVGLVHEVLYGYNNHNRTSLDNGWIMNYGIPFTQHFGKPFSIHPFWNPRNQNYLSFILPRSL